MSAGTSARSGLAIVNAGVGIGDFVDLKRARVTIQSKQRFSPALARFPQVEVEHGRLKKGLMVVIRASESFMMVDQQSL